MEIIPAIDLRGGQVVRLAQGDYARETRYPVEATALAQNYAAAGARWLHVVDLDGARSGALENLRAIRAIAETSLQVQAGGGVRGEGDVQRLFDAGVARVVVGSVAVRDPELVENWIARYGAECICIALDTRADANGWWTLPVKGWTEVAQSGLDELARRYGRAGARHLLCTDIERDGMMSGPNFALYTHLREIAPGLSVQASGGVRGVDDLRLLRDGGAAGAILGRTLLEGRLALADALQC